MTRRYLIIGGLLLASALAPAWAQVVLAPRFPPGTSETDGEMRFKQNLKVAGTETDTTVEVHSRTRLEATAPAADGSQRLKFTTLSTTAHLELPGGMKIDFDSAKPDQKSGSPEIDALLAVSRAIHGVPYTLVLDKDHKVTKVEGADAIIQAAPPETQDALKKELSLEKLRRETAQSLAELPDAGVKKGDRWQKAYSLDVGNVQKLNFENFYEYQGTVEKDGRTLDKISFIAGSVTFTVDGELPGGVRVTASDLKLDSSSGTILFDRELGRIVERSGDHRITGTITFSVNGMSLPATLDLTVGTVERVRK